MSHIYNIENKFDNELVINTFDDALCVESFEDSLCIEDYNNPQDTSSIC